MPITGEAYGGSMLVPAWTNQNLGVAVGSLSPNVESGAASSGFGAPSMPANNGYLAWSMMPEDAISDFTYGTANTIYLSRIVASQGGLTSKGDVVVTSMNGGTCSNFYLGLYSATGTQLAVTAESHASVAAGLVSLSWASPVLISAGSIYYVAVTETWATAGQKFAASTATTSAVAMNVNLTAATSNAASNGTGTTLPTSFTMSSNTAITSKIWAGLK